ncbi:DUF6286 domain-containing protein [Streptomyces sp. NBC_00201]|uniref:DUF6286 domain-containing protein n=1 Tax=unclassified Streptomyces TaxID=2593676 RepID=UPI00225C1E85|nr:MULTISPECIES: DUF6286 domain-containing protein [unclassified Streptomyces]MCX5058076.1 DUF6286 domain-containing protein [Streptomyces sp. NBC_00452]MCX5245044.1 DUF6286 domain-containing protein [Streptomyces sp. NBC_00201]MCX5289224.1 DUF6286 domain-containing protein [Streptomyces sp. NBC_00183]
MSEPQGSEGTTQRLPVIEKAPGGDLDHAPPPPSAADDAREGRFWSARRVPAGIVAALILAVAGIFLYDVAAVRAGRPAMSWRRELARQLAERPLDDTWVLVGAGVAAVLGLWLIVLAATPGLRGVLPMRRPDTDVHAGLYREAAALVLRDRAMEVAGVQSVRVRVRRSRADVFAVSHFREPDDVRADLDTALAEAVEGLGLSRPPALTVHVRRPGRKR